MTAKLDLNIVHKQENRKFYTIIDDLEARVDYEIFENIFDITHTIVPKALEGQGIAAQLVATAYAYARERGYNLQASCSYARIWLLRHPHAE